MNDFERRLADALKQTTERYRPSDPYRAKERFLQRARRRRLFLASGGVALAGATALAAFLFFSGDAVGPRGAEPLPPASDVGEVREIAVGQRPSGVAFGDGLVWVANAGDGTVMTIDPETRAVVDTLEVDGDPDDVAVGVGAAWVSDSGTGTVTSLSLPSAEVQNDPVEIAVGEPGSTHMDVAPGANGLWVAKDDSLWRIDPLSLDAERIPSVEGPTDVAVGEGSVYVVGTTQLARVDPSTFDVTPVTTVSQSRNQDLAFRDGYLWLADGDSGEVTRIDPENGQRSSPIYVGGNFSGIAVDEEAVWVISGGAGDSGVLTRIDPDTLAPLLPRAELSGRPYDITVGADRVWVANHSAGTVTAIDPNDLPNATDDAPTPNPPLVFAFGADGDIWGALENGDVIPLVQTAGDDSDPSLSPDASRVALTRGPTPSSRSRVIVVDIATGAEVDLGRGHSPRFGPDGRLAWVRIDGENDEKIAIGTTDEDPVVVEAISDYGTPIAVRSIVWDLQGDYVYYNAGWNESRLMQLDASGPSEPFEIVPGNHRAGAYYEQPSVRRDGAVHVIRVCCLEGPTEAAETVERGDVSIELGEISFTEGGPQYQTVAALAPLRGTFEFIPYGALDSAGSLTLDRTGDDYRWRRTVIRSWFVATSEEILLVSVRGKIVDVTAAFRAAGDRFRTIEGLETARGFDD